jgi:hypothetical protein
MVPVDLTGEERKSLQAVKAVVELMVLLLIKAVQLWCSVPLTIIGTSVPSGAPNL